MQHAANMNGRAIHLDLASHADWSKLARLLESLQPGARLTLHVDHSGERRRAEPAATRRTDSFAEAMRRVEATYYDAP